MRLTSFPIGLLTAALLAIFCTGILAEEKPQLAEALKQEFQSAQQDMEAAKQPGPSTIPLMEQATLKLPPGLAFVPNPQAARFMSLLGNRVDDRFLGLVIPLSGSGWIATLSFEKSGYIRDDDAKNWNPDDMLKNIRESAEDMNQTRVNQGLPELEVLGWAEPPSYDADNHRLVWALTVANRGASTDQPQSINYNTHALGREGYVSLNLVTASNELNDRKPIAQTLLASLDFNAGKRYADFNADTDHTAEYGLAALVGGAMIAKKFGLFALASVFVAKFGKIIALAALALSGVFGKRFGKKQGSGSLDA